LFIPPFKSSPSIEGKRELLNFWRGAKKMKSIPFRCCNKEWRYIPTHDKTTIPPHDKRLALMHDCPRLWISRINLDCYFVKRAVVLKQLVAILHAVGATPRQGRLEDAEHSVDTGSVA
jgi:hypothetical protein